MAFELPKLPYDYDALDPFIDGKTMELHHSKHHQAYVDNLNKALLGHDELLSLPIEDILRNLDTVPEGAKQAVINHGGGHANHSFFWNIMKPKAGGEPSGVLAEAIVKEFGSFSDFKAKFTEKAMTVFGSGWAFLIKNPEGKLQLKRHSFQNSPLMQGNTPILGIDVWEHAYYLKYQNRRAEYVENWWNVINWQEVEKNFGI
jgi:superoxide dismutase, Fe-Mn family